MLALFGVAHWFVVKALLPCMQPSNTGPNHLLPTGCHLLSLNIISNIQKSLRSILVLSEGLA
jgi:hypothetical protein